MISGHWENPGGILKFKVISLENTSFRHCVHINPKKEISENYKNSEIWKTLAKYPSQSAFLVKLEVQSFQLHCGYCLRNILNVSEKLWFRTCRHMFRTLRNSRPEMFCKKSVLRNFAKFTGKRLFQSLLFNKAAGFRAATLLKKRLWHRCVPVSFVRFLRTPFLTEHLRWLLLNPAKHRKIAPEQILDTIF